MEEEDMTKFRIGSLFRVSTREYGTKCFRTFTKERAKGLPPRRAADHAIDLIPFVYAAMGKSAK